MCMVNVCRDLILMTSDFRCSADDDQLLEKPRVSLSSAKLVREGFDFRYKTLDEMYHDMVGYGKAVGILPN